MNEKTQWVGQGVIGNGLIAYRATSSGQFQDRGKDYQMEQQRFPDEWLQRGYAWFQPSNDVAQTSLSGAMPLHKKQLE